MKNPAAYGGISINAARRKADHDASTATSDTWHYTVARRYPPARRFMGHVMDIRHFSNEDLMAMAEQTVISLIGCYGPQQHAEAGTDNDGLPWYRSAQQATLLTKLARRDFELSGFPRLAWAGCNVQSPLFTGGTAGRVFVRRSIPATPFAPAMHRYSTAVVPIVLGGGHMKIWLARSVDIYLYHKTIGEAKLRKGQTVNVIIDITKDGSRHPKRWIKVPEVGIYADFDWASCMAIYLEVYDASTQGWTRVKFFEPTYGAPTTMAYISPTDTQRQ